MKGKELVITERRRSAFTLIELLVVIAIIAIIAAILFPVFAQARAAARKTSCLSNLKQLGLGFLMYSQDYDETFPGIRFGNNAGEGWPWTVFPGSVDWNGVFTHGIQPYVKNKQILQCPSGTDTNRWSGSNGIGYCYNEYLYNYYNNFDKQSSLANAPGGPSKVSIVTECYTSGIYNDWETEGPALDDGTVDGLNRVRYHQYSPWTSNHDGSNVTYVDGHSKFLPKGSIRSYRMPSGWSDNRQRPIVYPGANEP